MSTSIWRRALVATALAAPLLIAPATAEPDSARTTVTTTATDADDTKGRLDVLRVRHRAVTDGPRTTLAFTVRTQRQFDDIELSWRHRHFVVELDTDGQPGAERNVTIFGRDGELRADLISNATRKVIAHLTAVRVDERTVRVLGPRRLLGARKVFWTSNYHRTGVPGCGWSDGHPITCQDSVPNRGWLRLDRAAWPAD
ncbi:MAG: hypothetical protein ACRDPQ_18405 [Nocardioidaceae bacterium]